MKRFHVHVSVENLAEGIRFYSALFDQSPAVEKQDYAKWMLDDPRINFAISARGAAPGVDHLGLQVDSDDELTTIHGQLEQASIGMLTQQGTACCYAESDKHWVTDPAGMAWEVYHTLGSIPTFNRGEEVAENSACCSPAVAAVPMPSHAKSVCTPGSGCC